jgi:hypothetical protein
MLIEETDNTSDVDPLQGVGSLSHDNNVAVVSTPWYNMIDSSTSAGPSGSDLVGPAPNDVSVRSTHVAALGDKRSLDPHGSSSDNKNKKQKTAKEGMNSEYRHI